MASYYADTGASLPFRRIGRQFFCKDLLSFTGLPQVICLPAVHESGYLWLDGNEIAFLHEITTFIQYTTKIVVKCKMRGNSGFIKVSSIISILSLE